MVGECYRVKGLHLSKEIQNEMFYLTWGIISKINLEKITINYLSNMSLIYPFYRTIIDLILHQVFT